MNLKDKIQEGMRKSIERTKNIIPRKAKEWLDNKRKTEKPNNTLSQESFKALLLVSLAGFGTVITAHKAKEYIKDYNPVGEAQYNIQNFVNNAQLKLYQIATGEGEGANTYSEYIKPIENNDNSEKIKENPNPIEQEGRPIMLDYLVVKALTNANFDFESTQTKILVEIKETIGEDNKISTPEEKAEQEKKVEERVREYLPQITVETVNKLAKEEQTNYKFTKEEIDETFNGIVKEVVRQIIKALEKTSKIKIKSSQKTREPEKDTSKDKTNKQEANRLQYRSRQVSQEEIKKTITQEKPAMTERDRIEAQVEYLLQNDPDSRPIPPFSNDKTLTTPEMIEHNKYVKEQKRIEEKARLEATDMVKSNRDINNTQN